MKRIGSVSARLCVAAATAFQWASAAEAPTPQMLEAAGAEFPIVTAGEGEPVLFVHGSFADYRVWDGLRDAVARDHRFVAYTQRWFGTTDWPEDADKAYSRDVHTADLIAILKARGEPTNLVGWSYSGPMVLRAAIAVPELVRSLVIYEPTVPEILSGTPEGEAAREQWFGLWADMGAPIEAGDFDEAIIEGVEAAFALPEGGSATLGPEAQKMWHENAHVVPMEWNMPAAGAADLRAVACGGRADAHRRRSGHPSGMDADGQGDRRLRSGRGDRRDRRRGARRAGAGDGCVREADARLCRRSLG